MKLKTEYLEEIKNQFEQDWNKLQENLNEKFGKRTFKDIFDMTETIIADEDLCFEYRKIFKEADVWTRFSEFSLYVETSTDNIVREYNRLYDNMFFDFINDGQCHIVKLTYKYKGSGKEWHEYMVVTTDLYNMDEFMFKETILRRSQYSKNDFFNIEYKPLGTEEYYRLMSLIADRKNYTDDDELVLFESKLYDEFYDSIDGIEDMKPFKKLNIEKLKKNLTKKKRVNDHAKIRLQM